jgi:FlaG/FlaF family flagellin (archaellin)
MPLNWWTCCSQKDRAVSSTVAVAMLLGITVVLVTVTGAFVFDLVETTKDNPAIPGNNNPSTDGNNQHVEPDTSGDSGQQRRTTQRYQYPESTDVEKYVYTIKFICGVQSYNPSSGGSVADGTVQPEPAVHSTAMNIYNYNNRDINMTIRGAALPEPGAESGESSADNLTINAYQTRELSCNNVFIGGGSGDFQGVVSIESPYRLNVLGIYSTYTLQDSQEGISTRGNTAPGISIKKVEPEFVQEMNTSRSTSTPTPGVDN